MGALTTVPLRANQGPGTEPAAFEVIDGKLVAPTRSVDDAGVTSQIATQATLAALLARTPSTGALTDAQLRASAVPVSQVYYPATTGNITGSAQSVTVDVSRVSNVMVSMVATSLVGHVATFEGSLDNSNWFTVNAVRSDSGIVETSSDTLAATPAYAWECSVNGLNWFRVRSTAHTSGTAAYTVQPGAYATEPVPTTIGPSARKFTFSQSGVIAINTVLVGPFDCTNFRGVTINLSSLGTTGQVMVQWSSDLVTWTGANIASYSGFMVVAMSGTGFYSTPVFATYCRLVMSTATTAGTTTIGVMAFAAQPPAYVQSVDTELPAAAALADAQANATTPTVGAGAMLLNGAGTTWDRARNNYNVATGDTGAKAATFNGATQTNFNARGAFITIIMGAVTGTTPTLSYQLQWSPNGGTTWINMGPASANITAGSQNHCLFVYPTNLSQEAGVTPANLTTGATQTVAINAPLPRTWRLVYTIGGTTPSFTISSVQVNYIN